MKKSLSLFIAFGIGFNIAIAQESEETASATEPVKSVPQKEVKIDAITTLAGKKVTQLVVGNTYKAIADYNECPEKLYGYINGVRVAEMIPNHKQNFHFEIVNQDLDSKERLTEILRDEVNDGDTIQFTIGTGPNVATALYDKMYELDFIETKDKWTKYLIVIAGLIIAFITTRTLMRDSNKILRDSGVTKDGKRMPPFSLARTQMAFWTIIVLISIIYIWWETGTLVSLTSQVLILLGISAGTTVTANYIDKQDLADPKVKIRHQDGDHDGNFFSNLVSDQKGLSIHRFQNVVFSLAIGLYFLYEVFKNHQIPELDDNLMALMGISSGTYLAIKKGENSKFQDEEKAKELAAKEDTDTAATNPANND